MADENQKSFLDRFDPSGMGILRQGGEPLAEAYGEAQDFTQEHIVEPVMRASQPILDKLGLVDEDVPPYMNMEAGRQNIEDVTQFGMEMAADPATLAAGAGAALMKGLSKFSKLRKASKAIPDELVAGPKLYQEPHSGELPAAGRMPTQYEIDEVLTPKLKYERARTDISPEELEYLKNIPGEDTVPIINRFQDLF